MKKILTLGTIPLLAFGSLLATSPAVAVPSDLSAISLSPTIITGSGTTDLTVEGTAPGAADFYGCLIVSKDGTPVEGAGGDYSASPLSLANTADMTVADLGNLFGGVVGNLSTTTEAVYTFNFYQDVDCLSLPGSADFSPSITLLPAASVSEPSSADFIEGEAASVEILYTANSGFDFSVSGEWTLAEGTVLPDGLSFTSTGNPGAQPTFTIDGTPTAGTTGTGTYDFVLSDSIGNSAIVPIQINITEGSISNASASFDSPLTMQENVSVNLPNIAYTNMGFDWATPGTVALAEGSSLPNGLTFTQGEDNADGSPGIDITGTPAVGTAGTVTTDFVVSDNSANTATMTLTMTINPATVITPSETDLYFMSGTVVDKDITLTFENIDFTQGGSCVVDSNTTPPGITVGVTLNAGIPVGLSLEGAAETVGEYNVVVNCADSLGNSGTLTLPVNVGVTEAPSFTLNIGELGGITMMQKVEGSVAVSVTTSPGFDFSTGGGTLTVSTPPVGITATGLNENTAGQTPSIVFVGKPTTVGVTTVTFTLTDSLGATATTTAQFNVIPAATTQAITLSAQPGQPVAGSNVAYSAEGLTYESAWTLVVASTPTTIASGTVPLGGSIGGTATMPSNLAQGWHTITLTAVNYDGAPVVKTLYFEVDANGNLVKTSELAQTGESSETLPLLIGGAAIFLLAGIATTVTVMVNRRKTA